MNRLKSITSVLIIDLMIVTAALPFGQAAVYAVSGAPGATEVALDLYGNNTAKPAADRTESPGKTGKEEKDTAGKAEKADKEKKADKTDRSGKAGQTTKTDGSVKTDKADKADAAALPAGSRHFAEALVQQYTPASAADAASGSADASGSTQDNKGDPASGFTLTADSRFYIVSKEPPSDELLSTVRLMDAQFAACGLPSTAPLAVIYGKADKAEAGDIVIELVPEDEFGHEISGAIKTADTGEAYTLALGCSDEIAGGAVIRACGTDGIYYGLLTLMEMLREKQGGKADDAAGAEAMTLPAALITDGPDLAERAVLLDCGRRYFSKEWIENFIRRASMQRYNAIVMHFSEAEGLRLDSRVFPWLTKGIDSLSMDEMAEIISTARTYHVDVIPSFDMPGHNRYMVSRYARYVAKHPDFSFEFEGKTYDRNTKGFGSIANHWSNNGENRKADYIGIDVTREHAVAFVSALVDDYADFFSEMGCSRFDMGGDELLGWYSFELGGEHFSFDNRWKALDHWAKYARDELGIKKGSASDAYVSFLNVMAERLESKGYTCRVFNDDLDINSDQHVRLKESVEVTYWFPAGNSARHFAKRGHSVHNLIENWCFYVLRKYNGTDIMKNKYKSVNARNIFYNWDPRRFTGGPNKNKKLPASMLAGGYFAVWCDHPDLKSDDEIWSETSLRMWANGSKMWNPEVSTGRSGIGRGMMYDDMKGFVKKMKAYPGYAGDVNGAPELPEPSQLESARTWWQDLFSF